MTRPFLKLRDDKRGVATIELALFAPVLATMIIGVVDMSNAFSRKLACEQAAQRAIEKVMQTTGEETPAQTIIDEASDQANVPEENVTVSYRLECDQVHVEDYDAKCADGEIEARYIEVEVKDVYEPMFPLHFASYAVDNDDDGDGPDLDGADGYPVSAKAGMRTQ
jgi:Flp pilus assembly pilin Flp